MNLLPFGGALADRVYRARWRTLDALAGAGRHAAPGSVALTFDDGPRPGSTDRLLGILADLEVQATFFCVGANAMAHPRLTRRIEAEGHQVGSHSLTHPHPARTPLRVLATDYARGREALEDVLGHEVALFRPPHGHLDVARAIMLRRQRLRCWLWSVDPQDWRPLATSDSIRTAVSALASSGSVVLMHDWVEQPVSPAARDRSATLAAVPLIVRDLRARGLTFVGVA